MFIFILTLGCVVLLVLGLSLVFGERNRVAANKRAAAIQIQQLQDAIRQYGSTNWLGMSNRFGGWTNSIQKP
jgi:hypothetical protein